MCLCDGFLFARVVDGADFLLGHRSDQGLGGSIGGKEFRADLVGIPGLLRAIART